MKKFGDELSHIPKGPGTTKENITKFPGYPWILRKRKTYE